MNYFAFLSFVSSVILFSLGIFVFFRNQKSTLHRVFLLLTLTASWWAFTEFMLRYPLSYPEAFFWMRMSAFWVFVPVLSLNFIWIFTHSAGRKPSGWIYLALYLPAVMFCILELTTGLINQHPVLRDWGYSFGIAENPAIFYVELAWGFCLMLLSFLSCLHFYLHTTDLRKKTQVKYLVAGFGLPSAAAFMYLVIFPFLGLRLPEMTIIFILFFSLLVAYAIWRYELFVLTPATAADTILSTITDFLVLLDAEKRIVTVNRAARDALGYTEAELAGQPVSAVFCDASGKSGDLPDISGRAYVIDAEMFCRKKDGTVIPVSVSGSVIRDASGTLSGIVIVSRDISERKRADNALKQVLTKLNLLSGITRHDILNQVTALTAYLELSRMKTTDPDTIQYLEKTRQIVEVIHRQILFTRDYEEMGISSPVWQNVEEGIRKSAAALPMGNVCLAVDVDGLEIFADPLFERISYNLIDNALRYGGDQLSMIRFSKKAMPEGLVLTCEDDGRGIDYHEKSRIFEKGFGKHTGFGLFLVREILSITGMSITENGIPGNGTRFEITIPREAFRYSASETGDTFR